ncbi:purine permease 21-like [Cynara cardunculus var. scolymus]|nr:purine permease 21-like [Cynara cardunculus var. scolymus]
MTTNSPPASNMAQETNDVHFADDGTVNERSFMVHWPRKHKKWVQMLVYTIFVLFGQSVATIMGRLYFNKGGNSIWLLTLVQTVGFPALVPFLLISPVQTSNDANAEKPKSLVLALLYVFLGVFLAALCVLYSIGLLYLPVSTYSLICASQLGFNAIFAYFLNQQKFTPYIMNSIFILTLSTVLLVFQNNSGESMNTSKGKYAFGFICTICASAGYALLLSLTQLSYRIVVKDESFRAVVAMIIYQSMVSSLVITIGLFASGDWKRLRAEMMKFELGNVAYVMILVSKAVCWQIFSIGTLGLIFKVSCLFSNVVSTVGLPIVPILAVVFFHEEINGVKMVSMVMAIWGFLSYMYQH